MHPAVDLCLPTAFYTSFSLVLVCFDTVVAELLQQLIIVESEISARGRTGTFCLVF